MNGSAKVMMIVYVVYVGLIVLLRWQLDLQMLAFALGVLMGLGFVYVDRLIQVFVVRPHEHLSEHVKHMLKEGRVIEAVKLLKDRGHEQQHLTVRSVFFMGAWVPVSVYVLTSTENMLAMGLVMGIGLKMLYEVWMDWANLDNLRRWLLWPVKRYVKDGEVKGLVILYTVLFVGLSLGVV